MDNYYNRGQILNYRHWECLSQKLDNFCAFNNHKPRSRNTLSCARIEHTSFTEKSCFETERRRRNRRQQCCWSLRLNSAITSLPPEGNDLHSLQFISYHLWTVWLTWPVEINCSLSRADQLLHDLFTFPLFSCWTAQVNTERTNVSSTCRILSNTFSIVPLELIPKDYFSSTIHILCTRKV